MSVGCLSHWTKVKKFLVAIKWSSLIKNQKEG